MLFRRLYPILPALLALFILLMVPAHGLAQNPPLQTGGEASLVIPDLSQGTFLGTSGRTLDLVSGDTPVAAAVEHLAG